MQLLIRGAPRPIPDDQQDALEERIDRGRDLRDFRFQVVELGSAADEAQVAEIFVRINSEGAACQPCTPPAVVAALPP